MGTASRALDGAPRAAGRYSPAENDDEDDDDVENDWFFAGLPQTNSTGLGYTWFLCSCGPVKGRNYRKFLDSPSVPTDTG